MECSCFHPASLIARCVSNGYSLISPKYVDLLLHRFQDCIISSINLIFCKMYLASTLPPINQVFRSSSKDILASSGFDIPLAALLSLDPDPLATGRLILAPVCLR
jgi:hypothetical protein